VAYVLAHHPRGAAAVIRIEMSPDDAEIYVVHRDGIAVLSALREWFFESTTVSAGPSCVAMSSGVGRLYIGASGSGRLMRTGPH
jgi:hypothetical protein